MEPYKPKKPPARPIATQDQIIQIAKLTDAYHHLLEATKHLEKGSARFLEVMGVAIEIKCDILSMKVGAK